MEYSECCGANRHHIWDELCADCLEHTEFETEEQMADITMCDGKGCEIKEICYRYKATPSEFRQSYFCDSPNKGLECDYYWEIKNE